MQVKSKGIFAHGEMFICFKLEINQGVRTFARIQKAIWYQLLASKAEVIQRKALVSFSCRMPHGK